MIASIEPLASGFCLTDPQDARYIYITKLRRRFGEFLHSASLSLQRQGEENTVDAVQMLVCTLMVFHGLTTYFSHFWRSVQFAPICSSMATARTGLWYLTCVNVAQHFTQLLCKLRPIPLRDRCSSSIFRTEGLAARSVCPKGSVILLTFFVFRFPNSTCARFYHSCRLLWNSIERARGPLENSLLDDVVEWSMWHYPSGK